MRAWTCCSGRGRSSRPSASLPWSARRSARCSRRGSPFAPTRPTPRISPPVPVASALATPAISPIIAAWFRNNNASPSARGLLARRQTLTSLPRQSGEMVRDAADQCARCRIRCAIFDCLRYRATTRRHLSGRYRRHRAALWRARRLYEPGLARRPDGDSSSSGDPPTRSACSRAMPVPRRLRRLNRRVFTGPAAPPGPRGGARESQWLLRARFGLPRPVLRPARDRTARHGADAAGRSTDEASRSAAPRRLLQPRDGARRAISRHGQRMAGPDRLCPPDRDRREDRQRPCPGDGAVALARPARPRRDGRTQPRCRTA